MNITINPFDAKSIDAALKELKQYRADFEKKEREFLRRLGEIGVSVASTGFANAKYEGDKDAAVRLIQTKDGYAVEAYGRSVGFIEFGTGIRNPEWSDARSEYTPPAHGTYGRGWGANPKGWYYAPNQHTYGHEPAYAMVDARDRMLEQIMTIAREVWNHD